LRLLKGVIDMANKIAACAILILLSGCNGPAAEPAAPKDSVTIMAKAVSTGTLGGKCKVVSGANSGKSGTYNADGDCEGDWGVSECKNQDGTDSGKCEDVTRTSGFPISGQDLSVASVTLLNDAGNPVQCTVALSKTALVSSLCHPAAFDKIENLRTSGDELDRRVADAVAPLLKAPAPPKK
jgi:hypothetical protein